jgi:hypothetical protein
MNRREQRWIIGARGAGTKEEAGDGCHRNKGGATGHKAARQARNHGCAMHLDGFSATALAADLSVID